MKKIVHTKNAPEPIGPYNQAVVVQGILYTSGQIAIDPITGSLVTKNIQEETQQVMENIKAILTDQGLSFEDVFKCTIFIQNMNDFAKINEIYGSYFNDDTAPARETVQVARLPKDVNIEISVMATMA